MKMKITNHFSVTLNHNEDENNVSLYVEIMTSRRNPTRQQDHVAVTLSHT